MEPRIVDVLESRQLIKLVSGRGALEILLFFCCKNERIRFKRLRQTLSHVSTKTLVTRLRELERFDLIERTSYNEIPPRVEYSLTQRGQELTDSLIPLLNWISKHRL